MNETKLRKLLEDVKAGRVATDAALRFLRSFPFEDIEFAMIDTHRSLRRGFPEVIYGQGKTAKQIAAIVKHMRANKENVLVTRVDEAKGRALKKSFGKGEYNATAGTFFVKSHEIIKAGKGVIAVVCAGTSDIPVAEEAAIVAEYLGNDVNRMYDVGVAGLHRLLHKKEALWEANVLIVAAGMEGALPSVIAGLVARPVVAVPTSVGYGANLAGITTLLAMLNSCASGVSVVNIDNGFGAAYVASLINKK